MALTFSLYLRLRAGTGALRPELGHVRINSQVVSEVLAHDKKCVTCPVYYAASSCRHRGKHQMFPEAASSLYHAKSSSPLYIPTQDRKLAVMDGLYSASAPNRFSGASTMGFLFEGSELIFGHVRRVKVAERS